MGNPSAALPLRTKALAIVQQCVNGSEHTTRLIAKSNLAITHAGMGSNELALPMYMEVLDIQRRVLGREVRGTLVTTNNLATLNQLCEGQP